MLHIKKVKPLHNNIVTTAERFEKDVKEHGIIISKKGDLKVWQTVLAVGNFIQEIKVGDKVMIDFRGYAVKKYDKNSLQNDLDNNPTITYALNWVTMDDENGKPQDCLLLTDRDIMYVFEGEEKEEVIELPVVPKIALS